MLLFYKLVFIGTLVYKLSGSERLILCQKVDYQGQVGVYQPPWGYVADTGWEVPEKAENQSVPFFVGTGEGEAKADRIVCLSITYPVLHSYKTS